MNPYTSKLIGSLAILLISTSSYSALGYEVREMDLEEKSSESELVVIGQVISINEHAVEQQSDIAAVHIDRVLK